MLQRCSLGLLAPLDEPGGGGGGSEELLKWEVVTLEVEGQEVDHYFFDTFKLEGEDGTFAALVQKNEYDAWRARNEGDDVEYTFRARKHDSSLEGAARFVQIEDDSLDDLAWVKVRDLLNELNTSTRDTVDGNITLQHAGPTFERNSDVDEEPPEWEVVTLEFEDEEGKVDKVQCYFVGVAHDIIDGQGVAVFFEKASYDDEDAKLNWDFSGFNESAEGDDRFPVLEDPDGTIEAAVDEWISNYFNEGWEVVALEVEGTRFECYLVGIARDIIAGQAVAVFFEKASFDDEGAEDLIWTFRGFDDSAEGDDRFPVLEDSDGTIEAAVNAWINELFKQVEDEQEDEVPEASTDGDDEPE